VTSRSAFPAYRGADPVGAGAPIARAPGRVSCLRGETSSARAGTRRTDDRTLVQLEMPRWRDRPQEHHPVHEACTLQNEKSMPDALRRS